MSTGPRLRLGILGAARHIPTSVIEPLRKNPDLAARIEVVAVAARDFDEAETFAKKWGIPKVYGSYEEMLADATIDAVYNVLPNALRCQWTVSALQAGKHVLCEAPLCCNAREAVVMQRAAEDAGRVMLEGSYLMYNPVTTRIRQLVLEGQVGKLQRIDLSLPVSASLDGSAICSKVGALLGLGSYCVGVVRALASEEPRVLKATAQRSKDDPSVDIAMSCDLEFPSGAVAHFACSVTPSNTPSELTVTGNNGVIRAKEWFSGKGRHTYTIAMEHFDGCGDQFVESMNTPHANTRDTFYYQMMTFADEVQAQIRNRRSGLPWDYETIRATPADSVRTMAVIDAIFHAAGMAPRPTTFTPQAPYDRIGRSKL